MSKTDILFLERHCPECGSVKAALDIGAAEDDEFRARDGQGLYVFSSQSPESSVLLLSKFGVEVAMPVMLTGSGDIINSPKKIIEYMERQGMSV